MAFDVFLADLTSSTLRVDAVSRSDTLDVWLLEIQITNPTVADSVASATAERHENTTVFECEMDRERHRLLCPLADDVDLDYRNANHPGKSREHPARIRES